VAIYLGEDAFVPAPSSGKAVERVTVDHVYWGERTRRAGRTADQDAGPPRAGGARLADGGDGN